jgi:hypothetical protein
MENKMKVFTIASLLLISGVSARFEVNLPGISVHFGSGPKEAPRKLDENGIFVFNPGIGLAYDVRDEGNVSGFSFIASAIYFKDCADRNMFSIGAGCRGRLMLNDSISIDLNLIPSLGIIESSKTFLPVVTAGMNYHFTSSFSTGLTFAFVPAFNDQDSNLGFFVLNFAF